MSHAAKIAAGAARGIRLPSRALLAGAQSGRDDTGATTSADGRAPISTASHSASATSRCVTSRPDRSRTPSSSSRVINLGRRRPQVLQQHVGELGPAATIFPGRMEGEVNRVE